MGTIPNTGTAITMGRVRNAYGLTGAARLRADLIVSGLNANLYNNASVSASGAIRLSIDFGGRPTPATY